MKSVYFLLFSLLALNFLNSCSEQPTIDEVAAKRWSRSTDASLRQKPAVYEFHRRDGTTVSISTAELNETKNGLVYDKGEILFNGFLVYPGKLPAKKIEEAIQIAQSSEGASYQSGE